MDEGNFKCLLSNEIFNDPVTSNCGHIFEEKFINKYLETYQLCPYRTCQVKITRLEPNKSLKELIVMMKLSEKIGQTANEIVKKEDENKNHVSISNFDEVIIKKYEFLEKHYELQKSIGNGSFGEAILAIDVQTNERKVLKAIVHSHTVTQNPETMIKTGTLANTESNSASIIQLVADVKKEAITMSKLDHPNILKFYECFESYGHLFIVTEYCEGGNLLEVLRKHSRDRVSVDFDIMKKWFRDLLNALDYLHDYEYIHRDIKPQNILFKEGKIKIADFGEAKHVLETTIPKELTKFVGTLAYMSPEMIDRKSYNKPTDIWSMGCVFYNIYFLDRPFKGDKEDELKKSILEDKLEKLDKNQNEFTALIKRMLNKEIDERPTVKVLLNAELFSTDLNKIDCFLQQTRMSDRIEYENNYDEDLTEAKTVVPNTKYTEKISNNNKIVAEEVQNKPNNTQTSCRQQQAIPLSLASNSEDSNKTNIVSIEKIWESLSASASTKDDLIHLQINVPDCDKRNPVSIVCVIDISVSMGSVVGNADGNKSFTRLDLVKHVLNVLIDSVKETDQIALITFSDKPNRELDLSLMNAANKRCARNTVEKLEQVKQGQKTYMIPALKMAYEVIRASPENNINTIILITDGKDSLNKTDFEKELVKIEETTKYAQLHTFGFSNQICSKQLNKIALKGGGIFGFIPDKTMIGTVFLNCIASTFNTYAQNVKLVIDLNRYELISPLDTLDRFTLFFGQQKNFLFKKKQNNTTLSSNIDNFDFRIEKANRNNQKKWKDLRATETILDEKLLSIQLARKKLLELCTDSDVVYRPLDKYLKSNEIQSVPEFLSEFEQTDENQQNPNNEQLLLAIQHFEKWGEHYLNSMYFAHKNEQCLNCKSPSMQIYTDKKFNNLVKTMTDQFHSIVIN